MLDQEEAVSSYPKVKEKLNYLKELVEDHVENLPSSDDLDAQKGHKSELVSKLHPLITQGVRQKENEFEFNKGAGM